jgi:hypothetical protein
MAADRDAFSWYFGIQAELGCVCADCQQAATACRRTIRQTPPEAGLREASGNTWSRVNGASRHSSSLPLPNKPNCA